MNLINYSINQLTRAADEVLTLAGKTKVLLFYGEMGAGKTTLIKKLCKQLGVKETVTSPTFSIVNEYRGGNGKIYHFDFYRLKKQSEALDLGYEEYVYSGNYCLIEWPEKIDGLLPEHYIKIAIEIKDGDNRQISVEQF